MDEGYKYGDHSGNNEPPDVPFFPQENNVKCRHEESEIIKNVDIESQISHYEQPDEVQYIKNNNGSFFFYFEHDFMLTLITLCKKYLC